MSCEISIHTTQEHHFKKKGKIKTHTHTHTSMNNIFDALEGDISHIVQLKKKKPKIGLIAWIRKQTICNKQKSAFNKN